LQGGGVSKVRYSVFTKAYIEQHLKIESDQLKKDLGEGIAPGKRLLTNSLLPSESPASHIAVTIWRVCPSGPTVA